jgi:hypothetical protein
MLLPKPRRQHLFWLIAFATGARSEAIIEATWDRVDWNRRTIDFRVPGAVYRNKRRVVAPISDALYPRLEAAYARRTDDYVIGLGERGKPSCTWRGCKENLKAIGIDERGVCRHVARHTVASWLLQGDPERGIAPASVYDVAKLLGDTVMWPLEVGATCKAPDWNARRRSAAMACTAGCTAKGDHTCVDRWRQRRRASGSSWKSIPIHHRAGRQGEVSRVRRALRGRREVRDRLPVGERTALA